jgi:hypothetical protein
MFFHFIFTYLSKSIAEKGVRNIENALKNINLNILIKPLNIFILLLAFFVYIILIFTQ